jgi:streptogramin lyase
MLSLHRVRLPMIPLVAALVAVPLTGTAQVDHLRTNDLPNPFQTIEGWAQMPDGREWGSTSAVAIDADGVSVWVGERCGANTCVTSDLDPILKFGPDGTLERSFGAGLIVWPHGIHVDHEGNVWVTDARDNQSGQGVPDPPATEVIGHQVHKFSPEGELLMSLGQPGGEREPGYFWQPNDVLVAPNGDIFVAEGHGNNPATAPARILKFNSEGEFLMEWGEMGNGPGEFQQPHALAMDSQGRLFVGDRSNNRIQIFDQDGTFIDMWYQFSRPSGLFIDHNDMLYSADSESGNFDGARDGWLRGIRIGSARTGQVFYFIPDPEPDCGGTCAAEGVAVDLNGVIYGAEVGPRKLQRYVR